MSHRELRCVCLPDWLRYSGSLRAWLAHSILSAGSGLSGCVADVPPCHGYRPRSYVRFSLGGPDGIPLTAVNGLSVDERWAAIACVRRAASVRGRH